LVSISCLSKSFCMAVGQQGMPAGDGYLTTFFSEVWNGSSWSLFAMPTALGGLRAVSCASTAECWAVGSLYTESGPPGTQAGVAEYWDGQTWALTTLPQLVAGTHSLPIGAQSISCPSSSACWTVGGLGGSDVDYVNGTWQVAPAPTASSGAQLEDVTCLSTSSCWAVGGSGHLDASALADYWTGQSWLSVSTAPPRTDSEDILFGVACPTTGTCIAVGEQFRLSGGAPLAEVTESG
jgi:hypothetical protein